MNHAPDHSNYEAWLLDRLEGNLTPAQEHALDAFLAEHPHLTPTDEDLPVVSHTGPGLDPDHKLDLKRMLPPTDFQAPLDDLLVARLEGDLDAGQRAALEERLRVEPEAAQMARLYTLTQTRPDTFDFPGKELLKRTLPPNGVPTLANLDDFLVAQLEGDLDPVQVNALEALLATDRQAAHHWRLMQHTRTESSAVIFPHKEVLKKTGKVIAIGTTRARWITPLRLAASVALLITAGVWWATREDVALPPVAQVNIRTTQSGTRLPEPGLNGATPTVDPGVITPKTVNEGSAQDHSYKAPSYAPSNERSLNTTPAPVEVVHPEQLAQQGPVTTLPNATQDEPVDTADPVVPDAIDPKDDLLIAEAPLRQDRSLAAFVADELRDRVLDNADQQQGPLNSNDAIAAVDKGLQLVAGDKAGLKVEHHKTGGLKHFDLRLGRHLAITASR